MTVDLNGPNYAAAASPIYRAVWDSAMPLELFAAASGGQTSPESEATMRDSLDALRARREAGTLYDADGRLAADLLQGELARAGYWGLLIPQQYGGCGATLQQYASFLTQVAAIESSVANLLSVHSCLGPAGVVRNFGSDEQKQRWLPLLARGERLGVFALTEPNAGSDLTALATQATLANEQYRVTGRKVFITNLGPGRVAALVCLIEDRPAVLVAQLPTEPTAQLQFIEYGIYAAHKSGNRGMVLRDFEVSRADLVLPCRGDGLTIAYHGLNQGRMSLCAVTAGTLRRMLAGLMPWVQTRRTYGHSISVRQLVQRRIGRLASLIVGCDALAAWCASLLDAGYRGELECMVAKIFAAEALKEATIELGLRTHGGRSFLHGNQIGDSLHDLLAPCIYEGESELLGLALSHSIGKTPADTDGGGRQQGWSCPTGSRKVSGLSNVPAEWHKLIDAAGRGLRRVGATVQGSLRREGAEIFKYQCEMHSLSRIVQNWTALLCVAQHSRMQDDSIGRSAGMALAASLQREAQGQLPRRGELQGEVAVGREIIEVGWRELVGVPVDRLARPESGDL